MSKKVNNKLSTKLSKIVGKVKLPSDFNDKKELEKYFTDKHLKNN